MLINKEYKDYKINSFNLNSIIILSTFAILIIFLSNALFLGTVNLVWANSEISNICVGMNPRGVVYDPDNQELCVANAGSNSVSVIKASSYQVIVTIPVGNGPYGIAYDSGSKEAYITTLKMTPSL